MKDVRIPESLKILRKPGEKGAVVLDEETREDSEEEFKVFDKQLQSQKRTVEASGAKEERSPKVLIDDPG